MRPLAGDERLRGDRRVIAALAALFWRWTAPARLWSNQNIPQRNTDGRAWCGPSRRWSTWGSLSNGGQWPQRLHWLQKASGLDSSKASTTELPVGQRYCIPQFLAILRTVILTLAAPEEMPVCPTLFIESVRLVRLYRKEASVRAAGHEKRIVL